ncbi:hypothetical protein JCM10207_002112 [Rhodosporidiobolus poonsookiae]
MTTKAPASAALLAQSQFLGPDLAPLLAPPTREPSADVETPSAPSASSQEVVPADKLIESGVRRSWKELATGEDGSWRREVGWWIGGMVVGTVVRSACFHPSLFGTHLLSNLAPLERDDAKWKYILAVRAWEVAVGGYVWRRVRSGVVRGEGALFGLLFALVSRVSLYTFENSYFLLPLKTTLILLLIDLVSISTAFSLLRPLIPQPLSPRPLVSALQRIKDDRALALNVVFGVGLATFATGLASYVIERVGGREFVARNVIEQTVPSYLLQDQLTTSEILEHPTVPIPSLRTYDATLSMASHLSHTLLTSLATLPFVSILPSLRPLHLGALVALVVGVPSIFILWDVMPVTAHAALVVGAGLGVRAAASAVIVGWTVEELRRAKTVRTVKLLLVDENTDEILAVSSARVETDVAGTLRKDETGVTHRRGVVKGEIEL